MMLEIGNMTATIYGALGLVGKRYGNNANTVELDGYAKFDEGLLLRMNSGLVFRSSRR